MGIAIAQRIRPHLPSCSPGFKYQALRPRFIIVNFLLSIFVIYRTKINKKRPGFAHI